MIKRLKQRGLSLVELLVVITLLGLVVFFSTMFSSKYVVRARDAKRKADLEEIKVLMYDHYFDHEGFPEDLPGCGEVPCERDGSSYGYQVESSEDRQWFKVFTNLENIDDRLIDEVGCRGGCGDECKYNYGVASTNVRVNSGCVSYYVCARGGECTEFEDPDISRCPVVVENDLNCGGVDCSESDNQCHDNRGKRISD